MELVPEHPDYVGFCKAWWESVGSDAKPNPAYYGMNEYEGERMSVHCEIEFALHPHRAKSKP